MNILTINASPRRKGVTSTLLREFVEGVNSHHVIKSVEIHRLNIKHCIGCLKCRPDKECILPRDDAHTLADEIRGSDLIVIGSPVYWGNIPGTLKLFFDRNVTLFEYCEAKSIKYIPRPQLKGKHAILIVSGGSPYPFSFMSSQSRGTIRSLKTILKAGGIKIKKIINVADSYNFEKRREGYISKIHQIAESL